MNCKRIGKESCIQQTLHFHTLGFRVNLVIIISIRLLLYKWKQVWCRRAVSIVHAENNLSNFLSTRERSNKSLAGILGRCLVSIIGREARWHVLVVTGESARRSAPRNQLERSLKLQVINDASKRVTNPHGSSRQRDTLIISPPSWIIERIDGRLIINHRANDAVHLLEKMFYIYIYIIIGKILRDA